MSRKQAGQWVRVCRDPKALRDETSVGPVVGPKEVWGLLRERAGSEDQECFYVVSLDTRMRIRGIEEVTRGTVNSTPVHPREVFRSAILLGARKVIVAHNHPAGSLTPSEADMQVTEVLREAGQVLDIPLVDHLILSEEGYYSFAEHGGL